MDQKIKGQEKEYLSYCTKRIASLKDSSNKALKQNKQKIEDLKAFFAENYADMRSDNDEFANLNITIESFELQNDQIKKEVKKLKKMQKKPYFGRFDFQASDEKSPKSYYVGLGLVQNEDKNLIYDWRADVCSLYYEDKMGKCSYQCPDGEISGNLTLKRQFKIEDGNLCYYVDNSMLINDDILMEQLSKNTTSKMHDIVSTIQAEQNTLIRDSDFQNTIVQGVAGSGKTSIAMHRVSYLLYKYRESLKSEDILILSPSENFSEYINDVLPSLGDDQPFTTTFNSMAKRLLAKPFQTREELLEKVITTQNQQTFEEIAIKSSFEFLEDLKKFVGTQMPQLFIPKTLTFGKFTLTEEEISDIFFTKLANIAVFKRIQILAEKIAENFSVPKNQQHDLISRAKKILYSKFISCDPVEIYNLFLASVGLEKIKSFGAYDIAPVLIIKEALLGLTHNFDAKYVIVDEMQDYTPCHFYLFEKLWNCAKLYLGDIYQSIDRTLPENYINNLAKLTKSKIKILSKSYRSTLQISLFSQKILGKHISNNVNRSGEEVEFIRTKNVAEEIEKYLKTQSTDQTIAIICKNKEQIKLLQKESSIIKKFHELNSGSSKSAKRIITTPAQAKGVEFDSVIVPFANNETYKNDLDRNLLYVSSTRALHKLCFISDKTPSKMLIKHK